MNFFNSIRTFLYVDNNGIITLDRQLSQYTSASLATVGIASIASYWTDVDTRAANGRFVYYKSTLDPTLAASGAQIEQKDGCFSLFLLMTDNNNFSYWILIF